NGRTRRCGIPGIKRSSLDYCRISHINAIDLLRYIRSIYLSAQVACELCPASRDTSPKYSLVLNIPVCFGLYQHRNVTRRSLHGTLPNGLPHGNIHVISDSSRKHCISRLPALYDMGADQMRT
ncbi:hypothetical protein E4T56_gene127, partial [Termitomyces sp. T112]